MPDNPWMVATTKATIMEGTLRDMGGVNFPLSAIEFAHPMTGIAGARYRYRSSKQEAVVVPAESMIMTHEQAKKAMAMWAEELKARPSDRPIMGLSVTGFEMGFREQHPSFLVKALSAFRESWREIAAGEKRYSLKEASPSSFLLPLEAESPPCFEGLREMFVAEKFTPESARRQVKAEVGRLETSTCMTEFENRKMLCHLISVMTVMEQVTQDQPAQECLPMKGLVRMLLPIFMVFLQAWAVSKQDLRKQALRGSNLNLVHVQDLLFASPFCESLFPAETITSLREAAKARWSTLEEYLGFSSRTPYQSGSRKRKNSRQRRAQKMKKVAQSQGQSQPQRGQGPQTQQQQQGSSRQGQGSNFRRPKHQAKAQGTKTQGGSGPSHAPSKGKGPSHLVKGGGSSQQ